MVSRKWFMEEERQIYTVSEITRNIKFILEEQFSHIWVEGEVSNLRAPSSGHLYFTLKDESAELRVAMFRNRSQYLKFRLDNGLSVIASGVVTVYERKGEYQLIVEELEPRGRGALHLAFEQLKKKLYEEGLFDEKYKQPLPMLPLKIGVVTSPTGAAVKDMINIIHRRFSNIQILLNPVKVQGPGAAEEIAEALDEFNRTREVDVIIIGRGGGSLEDLWAFNEEVVARAIYRSSIPVVSAVGHEVDYTISDFVADLRAPTPSAAAELVVPMKEELKVKIEILDARLKSSLINTISLFKERLRIVTERYVLRQPQNIIRQLAQRIDELDRRLPVGATHALRISRERLSSSLGKLESLNPLSILNRGYSLSLRLPQKTIIKKAGQLKIGDEVETKVMNGTFISRVEKVM
jgi:exodeoxyribonuclease VII large subunit